MEQKCPKCGKGEIETLWFGVGGPNIPKSTKHYICDNPDCRYEVKLKNELTKLGLTEIQIEKKQL